jgi:hypothetical protein
MMVYKIKCPTLLIINTLQETKWDSGKPGGRSISSAKMPTNASGKRNG